MTDANGLRIVVGKPFCRYCPACGQPTMLAADGTLAAHTVPVVRPGRPRAYRTCEGVAR